MDNLANLSAGFGDTLTLGATKWIRKKWNQWADLSDSVNPCSGYYKGGKYSAYAWEVVFGAASAARFLGTKAVIRTRAALGTDLATSQIIKTVSTISGRTIKVIHKVTKAGKTIHRDIKFIRFWPF